MDPRPSPRRARHAGCFAGQLTAAAVLVLECIWIWFVVECVPVTFVEPTAIECDPLPTVTRMALTLLAAVVALLAGAAVGGIVTRLRPPLTGEHGVSRPTSYEAKAHLDEAGISGLLPRKRGSRGPHKL